MVVVEERGTPAGLRQALRETRRKRGRAAPTGEGLHLLGNVAEIQNILHITKINLWSNLATRGMRVHLHTLVDR